MNFIQAMDIVEQGFEAWAAKEHNRKWVSRIEGTPIRNDLLVNIAEAICANLRDAAGSPAGANAEIPATMPKGPAGDHGQVGWMGGETER